MPFEHSSTLRLRFLVGTAAKEHVNVPTSPTRRIGRIVGHQLSIL
jgi:hypothetical protein